MEQPPPGTPVNWNHRLAKNLVFVSCNGIEMTRNYTVNANNGANSLVFNNSVYTNSNSNIYHKDLDTVHMTLMGLVYVSNQSNYDSIMSYNHYVGIGDQSLAYITPWDNSTNWAALAREGAQASGPTHYVSVGGYPYHGWVGLRLDWNTQIQQLRASIGGTLNAYTGSYYPSTFFTDSRKRLWHRPAAIVVGFKVFEEDSILQEIINNPWQLFENTTSATLPPAYTPQGKLLGTTTLPTDQKMLPTRNIIRCNTIPTESLSLNPNHPLFSVIHTAFAFNRSKDFTKLKYIPSLNYQAWGNSDIGRNAITYATEYGTGIRGYTERPNITTSISPMTVLLCIFVKGSDTIAATIYSIESTGSFPNTAYTSIYTENNIVKCDVKNLDWSTVQTASGPTITEGSLVIAALCINSLTAADNYLYVNGEKYALSGSALSGSPSTSIIQEAVNGSDNDYARSSNSTTLFVASVRNGTPQDLDSKLLSWTKEPWSLFNESPANSTNLPNYTLAGNLAPAPTPVLSGVTLISIGTTSGTPRVTITFS